MEAFRGSQRESAGQVPEVSRHEKEETVLSVKKLLMEIDGSQIKDIYAELLRKCGARLPERFISPEEVEVVYMNTNQKGNYYDGQISLNARNVPHEDGVAAASILSTYIHELAHFYSEGREEHTYSQDGYQSRAGDENDNVFLNEAVTELIADQVYREYIKRSGDKAIYTDKEGRLRKPASYVDGRKTALKVIDHISDKTGLAPDIVFKALTQGYFSNEGKEVKRILDEVLPPGVDFDTYTEQLKGLENYSALSATTRIDL